MKKQLKMTLLAFTFLLAPVFGLGLASASAQGNLLQQLLQVQQPSQTQQLPQTQQFNGLQLFTQVQNNIIAQQNCFSNEQIQQAVIAKQILPLNVVMNNAGVAKTSKVLPPISVCKINGALFYQFSILTKNGKTKKLILPATSPLS